MSFHVTNNLEPPKDKILEGFEVSILDDDLSKLSNTQKELVNFIEEKTKGNRFARRSDINPVELKPYLKFIYLLDLKMDTNGKLSELKIRLVGTGLTGLFGELTGQSLLNSESDETIKETIPTTRARVISSVKTILAEKKAIKTRTEKISDKYRYFSSDVIMFPLSENGIDITGIFSFVDLNVHGDIKPS